jgi:anthranilate synthase/aminodeoxychorismate synthase-like glutamine amidotransferase
MWILIDNYDSFSYILHHYLLQTGNECVVYRNDEITINELKRLNPERIIISPGPETPIQAGITMDVIKHFHENTPILGVCLGHQALGMFFGGELIHIPYPMHGKTSEVKHNGHELYHNIPSPCTVMRYHSLAIDKIENTGLKPLAYTTDDNILMAMVHEQYPCVGIQYHPESIGTNDGLQLLKNWAEMYR